MEKLFFTLVLALLAWLISLLTGRNRRQMKKVPEGMAILCQPPGKRYVLYALGVLVMAVVLFFGALYLMDGAPESGRGMWGLCIAAAVLNFVVCIVGGNMLAAECVYFDSEKLQINRAFRKPQVYQWKEIGTIRGNFDNTVTLYLPDGTKILTAGIGMVNYEVFCAVLKQECPGSTAEYYRSRTNEEPQKCVLRYGAEYYLLAVMGVLMLVIYGAILLSGSGDVFLQSLLHSDPSEWFRFWFAPVSGVVGMIALFLFCNTKVWYSPEGLTIQYPLRRKQELLWSQVQRIETVMKKKNGRMTWKCLRLYTKERAYKINLDVMTWGKDGFMTELTAQVRKYEIPCASARK